jgi:hypothetical protein
VCTAGSIGLPRLLSAAREIAERLKIKEIKKIKKQTSKCE